MAHNVFLTQKDVSNYYRRLPFLQISFYYLQYYDHAFVFETCVFVFRNKNRFLLIVIHSFNPWHKGYIQSLKLSLESLNYIEPKLFSKLPDNIRPSPTLIRSMYLKNV